MPHAAVGGNGGGLYQAGSNVTNVTDCLFTGNQASARWYLLPCSLQLARLPRFAARHACLHEMNIRNACNARLILIKSVA